ncbi:MAG: hypothetical protein ACM3ZB_00305 [bacterium]|jgi:hypothetical protein
MHSCRVALSAAALVVLFAVLASPAYAADGPALGKWAFTGKDNSGLVWKGTLMIEKIDPDRFQDAKYHSMCDLTMESTDETQGTMGVAAPCTFDAQSRTISFSTGATRIWVFSAVVSADGKSLSNGKWTRTNASDNSIIETGEWSAKLEQ